MRLFLLLILLPVYTLPSWATDIIRLPSKDRLAFNNSYAYEISLIAAALDVTKHAYGDYKIEFSNKLLPRARTLQLLVEGQSLNVVPMATNQEWETKADPIFFPLLKGIIGYRLLLVNKAHLPTFRALRSLEELKALQAGQDFAWSSGKVMKNQGFKVYNNSSGYEMLLKMLAHNRYDYFPHGIHEIDDTLELAKNRYPNIQIEPTKLLLMYQPAFLFVSPKTPHLKKRLEQGLWKILDQGLVDELFNAHYNTIKLTQDVTSRTVLYAVPKNLYEVHPIFNNPKLWFLSWPTKTMLSSK